MTRLHGEPSDSRGLFTAEEYASAHHQAELELQLQECRRRGSEMNARRRHQGTRLHMRALQILWLRRALGSTYGRQEG